MPAVDHDARIRADLHELITQNYLDDVGFNVAWDVGQGQAQVPGQDKPVQIQVIMYRIVLTMRSPLLGERPDVAYLAYMRQDLTGFAQGPSRDTLARIVREGVTDLRRQVKEIHDEAMSGVNGHKPVT